MYKHFYTDESVIAWDELAYGGLKLRVGDNTEEGKDIVTNGEYVAIGYAYTGGISKLYKEVK